jgi:ribonuclease J
LGALRVILLGGCGEFGRNLTVYEAGEDLVAVDCGGQIPDGDSGVDLWVPDLAWLEERRARLRAWVLTHGHDDHLRALPYALERCPAPVHARPLTLQLARDLLAAAGGRRLRRHELLPLEPGARLQLGALTVEAVAAAHSIPDACSLAIEGAGRRVVHTGDLKLDAEGRPTTDLARLAALGQAGVDLMVTDSTNAARPGRSGAEEGVARALARELERVEGRAVVTLFSSHLERIGRLIDCAARLGRKVALVGRGLRESADAARRVGVLRPPAGTLVDEPTAARLPRAEVALLVTGSQGEVGSALRRLVDRGHPRLQLEPGDTVIFSSRPVPGNELRVEELVDRLIDRGLRVVDGGDLHASGHAAADELSELFRAVRPRAVLPVHGRPRQLAALARLAARLEIPALDARDGDVVEVGESVALGDRVVAGRLAIEGRRVGDAGPEVQRARARLGRVGVVVVALVGARARAVAHGVCDEEHLAPLLTEAETAAEAAWRAGGTDPDASVKRSVAQVFWRARGKRPEVLLVRG